MKIDVYDSYATARNGQRMHFDVLVTTDTAAAQAHQYGQQWLQSIGESAHGLQQSHCQFCHTAAANPEVARHIQQHGYFILQMEGCPAPY